ncbi:MAG: potassium channel family protein [Ignavibacteriales bacterium]
MAEYAVIGLGRFGAAVAGSLDSLGHSVLGIDKDEHAVNAASAYTTKAVQCDATDEQNLKALGLRNFDTAIVAIGDLQASILVTLILKELGVKEVVAKASNEHHGKVLYKIGADRVVFPEREMGMRVAHNISSVNILDMIELSPEYSIVELTATKALIGKSLKDLDLRNRYQINVIAIRRGREINLTPNRDDTIKEGDTVVMVGKNDRLRELEEAAS